MQKIFSIKQSILLFACLFFSINSIFGQNKSIPNIIIQPLGSFPKDLLSELQISISNFYHTKVTIAPNKSFPKNAFYVPRQRYRADSLIEWLHENNNQKNAIVAGITEKDISTTKDAYIDWGVMGLGFQPGDACIISTYRIKNKTQSKTNFLLQAYKLLVHEIGHNLGLSHCPNKSCIMADAEGKNNLDKETGLCEECQKKIFK